MTQQDVAINASPASKGFFMAVMAAICWGVSGTFGQFLFQERGINIEWLITVRLLISGIILLLIARGRAPNELFVIWKNKKDSVRLIIFSLVGMSAVQYTYFAAINYSNAATATILQYSGPVMIAIYMAIINKRFPIPKEVLAIILAVVGMFLLVTHGDLNTLTISPLALTMGILSAVSLAFYTLYPGRLITKYDAVQVIGWAILIGGIAFSFIKAPWDIQGTWDSYSYMYFVFIIVFGTIYPFYAYLSAVQLIGGQKASLLTSLEPLSAALIAVIWLKVSFQPIDWIGSLCIISTVFLLSTERDKAY